MGFMPQEGPESPQIWNTQKILSIHEAHFKQA